MNEEIRILTWLSKMRGKTHRNLSNWYIYWQASICMTLLNEIRLQSIMCNKSHKWRLVHTLSSLYKNTESLSFIFPYTWEQRRSNPFTVSLMTSRYHITIKWIFRMQNRIPVHTLFIFSVWILISCLWNTFQCKIRGKSRSGFCLDFEMGPQGRSLLSCHRPCSTAQKFPQIPQST